MQWSGPIYTILHACMNTRRRHAAARGGSGGTRRRRRHSALPAHSVGPAAERSRTPRPRSGVERGSKQARHGKSAEARRKQTSQ